MAQIDQHVLEKHADHKLVLDDENTFAGRRIALKRHAKYNAPFATGTISNDMRHLACGNNLPQAVGPELPVPNRSIRKSRRRFPGENHDVAM
jgi:hypothetical protein